MVQIKHHGTSIRFICDHLWQEVHNQIRIEGATERASRLRESVVPLVPGTSIILACSYIERVVFELKKDVPDSGIVEIHPSIPIDGKLNKIQRYFDLDIDWDGWEELGNFFRLRHCFAHELGRLTDRQKSGVKKFLDKLNNGTVISDEKIVEP